MEPVARYLVELVVALSVAVVVLEIGGLAVLAWHGLRDRRGPHARRRGRPAETAA
jgi:hypothetical protein